MPTDRDTLALDERTARLGRELFAEVRRQQRDAAAEEKLRAKAKGDTSGDAGPFDWLFGDGDSDGDGGDGD